MEFYHWVGVWAVMLLFGLFWLAYAIKLILNDEIRLEKRRRNHRIREERRRAREDREAGKPKKTR